MVNVTHNLEIALRSLFDDSGVRRAIGSIAQIKDRVSALNHVMSDVGQIESLNELDKEFKKIGVTTQKAEETYRSYVDATKKVDDIQKQQLTTLRQYSAEFNRTAAVVEASEAKLVSAFEKQARATANAQVAQERYNTVMNTAGVTNKQLVTEGRKLAAAKKAEVTAINQLRTADEQLEDSQQRLRMAQQANKMAMSDLNGELSVAKNRLNATSNTYNKLVDKMHLAKQGVVIFGQASKRAFGIVANSLGKTGQKLVNFGSQFRMEFLSVLSFGMAIMNLFRRIASVSLDAMTTVDKKAVRPATAAIFKMQSAFMLLKVTIAEALFTALEPFIDSIINLIIRFADWISRHEQLVAQIIILGVVIGGVLFILGQFGLGLTGVAKVIGDLLVWIGALIASLAKIEGRAIAIKLIDKVSILLETIVTALKGVKDKTIKITLQGYDALKEKLSNLRFDLDGISNVDLDSSTSSVTSLTKALNALAAIELAGIAAGLGWIAAALAMIGAVIFPDQVNEMGESMGTFGSIVRIVANSVRTAFFSILAAIRMVFEVGFEVIKWFGKSIGSFFSGLGKLLMGGVKLLIYPFVQFFNIIKAIFPSLASAIEKGFGLLLYPVKQFGTSVSTFLIDAFTGMGDAFGGVFKKVSDFVVKLIGLFKDPDELKEFADYTERVADATQSITIKADTRDEILPPKITDFVAPAFDVGGAGFENMPMIQSLMDEGLITGTEDFKELVDGVNTSFGDTTAILPLMNTEVDNYNSAISNSTDSLMGLRGETELLLITHDDEIRSWDNKTDSVKSYNKELERSILLAKQAKEAAESQVGRF